MRFSEYLLLKEEKAETESVSMSDFTFKIDTDPFVEAGKWDPKNLQWTHQQHDKPHVLIRAAKVSGGPGKVFSNFLHTIVRNLRWNEDPEDSDYSTPDEILKLRGFQFNAFKSSKIEGVFTLQGKNMIDVYNNLGSYDSLKFIGAYIFSSIEPSVLIEKLKAILKVEIDLYMASVKKILAQQADEDNAKEEKLKNKLDALIPKYGQKIRDKISITLEKGSYGIIYHQVMNGKRKYEYATHSERTALGFAKKLADELKAKEKK